MGKLRIYFGFPQYIFGSPKTFAFSSKKKRISEPGVIVNNSSIPMSERSLNPKDPQDLQPTQQSNDPGEGGANKNNVISIASKQISDVIQFQEPTTSKNFSFTTEIRINILGEPNLSKQSFESDDSPSCLLHENDFHGKKGKFTDINANFF